MNLDVLEVIELLELAIEKREEEKAWQMWLTKYQNMDKKSFIPFSQFYKKAISTEINQRPTEDILKEVEEIRKRANPQIG
jgi:hypothetical protein